MRRDGGRLRFQKARPRAAPPFHANAVPVARDAINSPGSRFDLQGSQVPTGAVGDPDRTGPTDNNGQIVAISLAGTNAGCRLEQTVGIVQESAHKMLISRWTAVFEKLRSRPVISSQALRENDLGPRCGILKV